MNLKSNLDPKPNLFLPKCLMSKIPTGYTLIDHAASMLLCVGSKMRRNLSGGNEEYSAGHQL